MPALRLWVHPPSEDWSISGFKKSVPLSTKEQVMQHLRAMGRFPTPRWFNYIMSASIKDPRWESSELKRGGSFTISQTFHGDTPELVSQIGQLVEFLFKDSMRLSDGQVVDPSFYFVGANLSINRRMEITPKLWIRDSNLCQDALQLLEHNFSQYEFTFESFDGKLHPITPKVALGSSKDGAMEKITKLLNNLNAAQIPSAITDLNKILKTDSALEIFRNEIIRHLYRNKKQANLLDLCTEVDFSHPGLLEQILGLVESTAIEDPSEETAAEYRNNLMYARTRLHVRLFGLGRMDRKTVTAFMQSVFDAKQLDMVIELLRGFHKIKNDELVRDIRTYITTETKKKGHVYYHMLDIFDGISASE